MKEEVCSILVLCNPRELWLETSTDNKNFPLFSATLTGQNKIDDVPSTHEFFSTGENLL